MIRLCYHNLLERNTLWSINLWLKVTDRSQDKTEVPRLTKELSSSLTHLIFPFLAANQAGVYSWKNTQISIWNSSSHPRSSPGGASSPSSLLWAPVSDCFMVIISLYSPELPTAVGLRRTGRVCMRFLIRAVSIWGPTVVLFALSLLAQAQQPTSQLIWTFFK